MGISVNDTFYGWASIEFTLILDGQTADVVAEMQAMSWGHATTITNVYGAGRTPIGQVIGTYNPEDSTLTFLYQKWAELKIAIGDGWMGTQVAIKAKYRKPGQPIHEVVIEGSISGESQSVSQGDEPLTVDVTVVPVVVKTDGITPYKTDGS